jgi:hypothetical protein
MKKIHFAVLLAFAMQNVHAQSWNTAGNSDTNDSSFLGTIDNRPLIFKTNNKERGRITVNGIWRFGKGVQIARGDIYSNGAIFLNEDKFLWNPGSENVAIGKSGLSANTTGFGNVAAGSSSLFFNTEGNYNSALGRAALYNNTIGFQNTAVGANSLFSNTTGRNNSALGFQALYNNTLGVQNTAIGVSSLFSNTTGVTNTAIGGNCLYSNTTGNANSAYGDAALWNNSTGNSNSALGNAALFNNTTGGANTAQGDNALSGNTTGSYNTAIGAQANVNAADLINATAIGWSAIADASNKVCIGNTLVTSIGGQVGWTTFSDGRYKKNIKENVPGLAFINSLRPVTYTVDVSNLNSYYSKEKKQTSNDLKESESFKRSVDEAGKIIQTGFVAQEVETAANKLGYDFNGVDKPKNKDGVYGLRYDNFVVPLVKAVQELSKANDTKDAKIDEQQKRIDELESKLNRFETMLSQCCASHAQSPSLQSIIAGDNNAASLQQNVPNPFNNTTTISYTLPQKFSSARIMIIDKNGKILKQLNLQSAGKGVVYVEASTLTSGAYNYSLYVDGKLIGSRQMILSK